MSRIGPSRPVKWFLTEWREHRGLTQEQLGERMETTKSQVSKLERGSQRMNDDWIAKASFALGIEPGDLLRDPHAPTVDELLRGATPEQRRQAIKIVRSLLDEDAA